MVLLGGLVATGILGTFAQNLHIWFPVQIYAVLLTFRFERLEGFRGDAALSTWLHTIATSVVLNGLRKVKRFRQREADLDEAGAVPGRTRHAEPDLKLKLARAIDALPERSRMVFVMHDVEGYTHEEIGGALGMEAGTSKAQLSRARARLRESLAEFAGEWAS